MKKILIVDDQSFIREVLKRQLEQLQGVVAIEASNGNEAIGKLKVTNPKPGLILLDIVMPNKDGFEVLEELRNDPDTFDIPVIVVSSHADEEKVARAKGLGVREFIDKAQLNEIDFLGLVERYLQD